MKKLNWLLSLVIFGSLVAISSCKDDDPMNTSLTGTWLETSNQVSNCTDPTDNEPIENCTAGCETIVITETTIIIDGATELSYTKTATTITVTDGVDSETVSYSISGTTLTISQQNSLDDGGCKYITTYKKI
ncbi:MAG: hypothetical protein JNM78_06770 [Cyclobacteriaceae bacterium]|nr:hypothetical protein [Cyclobacteriaceae bacterium]